MNIQINKDFLTEYRNDFWKGFSPSELVYLGIGGAIALCTTVTLHFCFGISPSNAIYVSVPLASPVVITGFYKYQGYMSVRRWIDEMIYTYRCRTLSYESLEEKVNVHKFEMYRNFRKRGSVGNGIRVKSK